MIKSRVGGVETEKEKANVCLRLIYAINPFESLSNPESKVHFNGKALTVLKDQLSRSGTGFDEYSVLARVHNPEKVPGVVQAVYHELSIRKL